MSKRIKSLADARVFNEKHPVGTVVLLDNKKYRTWAPAGLNWKEEPAVFLDSKDLPEPILLSRLTVLPNAKTER